MSDERLEQFNRELQLLSQNFSNFSNQTDKRLLQLEKYREEDRKSSQKMLITIGIIEKSTTNIERSVDRMTESFKESCKEFENRLDTLEKQPGEDAKYYKRYAFGCVISVVVGAVAGAVINMVA